MRSPSLRPISVVALCAMLGGCAHNAVAPQPADRAGGSTPQVSQGYGGGQSFVTVHVISGHSGHVVGLVNWHGAAMTALEQSGATNAVLSIGEGGAIGSVAPIGGLAGSDAVGPDGNLWVTSSGSGSFGTISQVTPGGSVTAFLLPRSGPIPTYIAPGSDGALWFAEGITSVKLGRITTGGVITEFPNPDGATPLATLVTGLSGELWSDDFSGHIYKIATDGSFTTYNVAGMEGHDLIPAAGSIWFSTLVGSTFDLNSMATNGAVTQYPPPAGQTFVPEGVGPGGNLWGFVTDASCSLCIGNFDVTSHAFSGPIAQLPSTFKGNGPAVEGPDGNLWLNGVGERAVTVFLWQSLTASPSPLSIAAPGDHANLTVSETNYSGNWSGSSSNPTVATVARSTIHGELTVTAVGVGACVLRLEDADHNTVKVKVTVQ